MLKMFTMYDQTYRIGNQIACVIFTIHKMYIFCSDIFLYFQLFNILLLTTFLLGDRLRMGTEKAGTNKKAGTNQYTGIGTRYWNH